jgi:hypothetical protein
MVYGSARTGLLHALGKLGLASVAGCMEPPCNTLFSPDQPNWEFSPHETWGEKSTAQKVKLF